MRPLLRAVSVSLLALLGPNASAAEEESKMPTCDSFFDKWDVPGLPTAMLSMSGIGHELMAAKDCLDKNNVPTACQHWSKVLEVTGRLGPPFDEDTVGIENLMREHNCASTSDQ